MWAAVDPIDGRALAVASKTTALIAADTYRWGVPSTVCERPIHKAVAIEARQGFKHRRHMCTNVVQATWGLWHIWISRLHTCGEMHVTGKVS